MVLIIVQPVDHRGVLGYCHKDVLVVAHALLAEHVNHVKDFVPVVNLRDTCGEDSVPEDCHLLLQRSVRVNHVVEPSGVSRALNGARLPGPGMVAKQFKPVHRLLPLRME